MRKLPEKLRTISNMINMGEKIRWGEETALMDEAADEIEAKDAKILELEQVLERVAMHNPDDVPWFELRDWAAAALSPTHNPDRKEAGE